MVARLQSPNNINLLKTIVSSAFMYYSLIALCLVLVFVLIKIAHNIVCTKKWIPRKPYLLNFFIYKFLVLACISAIARVFVTIIFFVYTRTIWALLELILWKINMESLTQNSLRFSTIIHNVGLLLLILIFVAVLIPTIFPFSSWKKLWKLGIRIVFCLFSFICLIGIVTHIID